jgi:hypothetical protein
MWCFSLLLDAALLTHWRAWLLPARLPPDVMGLLLLLLAAWV